MSLIYRLKIHAPILVLCLLWFVTTSYGGQFKVIRVTDGDTIKVTDNGTVSTIRLVGIDAPETLPKLNVLYSKFFFDLPRYFASF